MALADEYIGQGGRSPVARCLGPVDGRSLAIASLATRLLDGLVSSALAGDVR
jgi:hypothetical protein